MALVFATVLAYHPVWRAGFIWDDDAYVTHNPLLTAPGGLRRIWFSLDSPSQYFPLTYTTFYLERVFWGLNPAGCHGINLLLHSANALLAWRLLARLRLAGAWLAAALFALHPVQVESVAWITERKNVLMVFFFLLALLAWAKFIDETTKRTWRFYAMTLLFYALALSAKTTACTLPAALLLVLWLKKMPIGWRRWAQVAPFAALGVGMGLLTIWWERYRQGTLGSPFSVGPLERVLIASRALWFYAGKLLWPADLTFTYPRWTISASDPSAYGWLLATAVVGVLIGRARRWLGRGVEVAMVFFAVTLSPVLGFIMLYTFRYSFVADHYQYLACLGPLTLAAAAIERVLGWAVRRDLILKPMFCAVLLAILGALTWVQCGQYADVETLWRTTLAKNPGSWMAHNNLGNVLRDQGRVVEAIEHYQKALDLQPDYAMAHNNLGNALLDQGKVVEAVAHFRKALDIQPAYAEAHNNLGYALINHGEIVEAVAHFRKALDIQPAYAEAHNNLGNALFRQGHQDEAIAQYREALEIAPENAAALSNLGSALAMKGAGQDAIAQYRKALKIRPHDATINNNLGRSLLLNGELDEAMLCFEKSATLSPDPLARWSDLGKGFLQKEDLEAAIVCYWQVIAIAPRAVDAYANLGTAFFKKGEIKKAIGSCQKALDLNPDQMYVRNNLGWLLATTSDPSIRNGTNALALATRANQLSGGGNPVFLRTLAAAYAETGSYGQAAVTARRALELAVAEKQDALAATLQKEIKLYEADTPQRNAPR
jgi:tetratricopeptide (TPR) repeat protein